MKSEYVLDDIDKKIIELIRYNARIQWQEIGESVHMTGQAVGVRIRRLIKSGVIEGFHTVIKEESPTVDICYIAVLMNTINHKGFLDMTDKTDEIKEVYKTSGSCCYFLRVETKCNAALESVLDQILEYGNYQISSVIKKHK